MARSNRNSQALDTLLTALRNAGGEVLKEERLLHLLCDPAIASRLAQDLVCTHLQRQKSLPRVEDLVISNTIITVYYRADGSEEGHYDHLFPFQYFPKKVRVRWVELPYGFGATTSDVANHLRARGLDAPVDVAVVKALLLHVKRMNFMVLLRDKAYIWDPSVPNKVVSRFNRDTELNQEALNGSATFIGIVDVEVLDK